MTGRAVAPGMFQRTLERFDLTIKAVFFDLGGVLLGQNTRRLANNSRSAWVCRMRNSFRWYLGATAPRRASLGEITDVQHWDWIAKRLGKSASEIPILRQTFFAGDILDRSLLELIRSLKSSLKTGSISNAWSDLRDYIRRNRFEDAFDSIVISAEVGLIKPDPKIFRLAFDSVGVPAQQSVMVDDFAENVEAGRAPWECRAPISRCGGAEDRAGPPPAPIADPVSGKTKTPSD